MKLDEGDNVTLRLEHDVRVSGEVVDINYPDMFSEGWTVLALITEGGHPNYGQVQAFPASHVSKQEVVTR